MVMEEKNETLKVSPRIAVRLTFSLPSDDYRGMRITKLKLVSGDWIEDSAIELSGVNRDKLTALLAILKDASFPHEEPGKVRFSAIDEGSLRAVLRGADISEVSKFLVDEPGVAADLVALQSRRLSLEEFRELLQSTEDERRWQEFFEKNQWIFGGSLDVKIYTSVTGRLEENVVGSTFRSPGRRADAILRSQAAVSQTAFVELKRPDTPLLKTSDYRGGCFPISGEVAGAVAQIQRTVLDFERANSRVDITDEDGNTTGEVFYSVRPKAFVVAGRLDELRGNLDRITSFELARRHYNVPEIVTFDELFARAKFSVEVAEARSL